MMEEKKFDEILKDWQIDMQHYSAIHTTGIKMICIRKNPDGTVKTSIENFQSWMQQKLREEKTPEQIDQEIEELGVQFAYICYRIFFNNKP